MFIKTLFVICVVICVVIFSSHASSKEDEGTSNNEYFTLDTSVINQGQLVRGKLKPQFDIKMNGNRLAKTASGEFVFGVGRDSVGNVELRIFKEHTLVGRYDYPIHKRKWKVERIDGLPASKVNPRSEQLLKRIRKEAKLVKVARSNSSNYVDFTAKFVIPAHGRISGVYGSQRVLNGVKKRPHFGQDIANKVGTDVIAPASGVVTLAEDDLFYSGGTIIIDHGYGVFTTYLHLSQINVKVGQRVKQKSKIGEIGATGRASGPHLDWRLNWNTTRLDPALLIESSL